MKKVLCILGFFVITSFMIEGDSIKYNVGKNLLTAADSFLVKDNPVKKDNEVKSDNCMKCLDDSIALITKKIKRNAEITDSLAKNVHGYTKKMTNNNQTINTMVIENKQKNSTDIIREAVLRDMENENAEEKTVREYKIEVKK